MTTEIKKKLDYSGHNIYVGLDVHKMNWGVTILTEYLEHKTFVEQASPKHLHDYLVRMFPNANYYSAYEAGFCGFWIDKALGELGINNIVVNPADIPSTNKERKQKTDKRDARKIALMLRSNNLKAIFSPSQEALEDRQLVRSRKQLVKDGKRCKNRIKSTLNLFGIKIPEEYDKPYWSKAFVNWLTELKHSTSVQQALSHQLSILEFIENQKKEIDRNIVALSTTSRYEELVKNLRSLRGVGLLGSMVIITEIIDITRFNRPDHLHSYAGLIPSIHSSGDKEYTGGITKRSNPYLRPQLIQCAWVASKKDPDLALVYASLRKRGMKSNRAIISVAKKLLNRIRYIWRTGEQLKLI